nr:hypothetical protein BaRGS_002559 [Batillaria attramentaria]
MEQKLSQFMHCLQNWDHWNCILDYAKLAWVNYGQREPTVYLVDVNGHQIKMDIKHTRPGSATSVGMSSKDEPATLASLQARVRQLEKDLGESESEKLDLQDRIQALEERLSEVSLAASAATHGDTVNTVTGAGDDGGVVGRKGQPQGLSETLKAKDHYIEQLEKQLATTQGEANKTMGKVAQRHTLLQVWPPDEEGRQSKMKVILNLSAQVSEQAEKIARLEKDLEERDSEIRMLMEDYAPGLSAVMK